MFKENFQKDVINIKQKYLLKNNYNKFKNNF